MREGGGDEVQMPLPNKILRPMLLISAITFALAVSTFALAVSAIAP
jgi:hypothetical protein